MSPDSINQMIHAIQAKVAMVQKQWADFKNGRSDSLNPTPLKQAFEQADGLSGAAEQLAADFGEIDFIYHVKTLKNNLDATIQWLQEAAGKDRYELALVADVLFQDLRHQADRVASMMHVESIELRGLPEQPEQTMTRPEARPGL